MKETARPDKNKTYELYIKNYDETWGGPFVRISTYNTRAEAEQAASVYNVLLTEVKETTAAAAQQKTYNLKDTSLITGIRKENITKDIAKGLLKMEAGETGPRKATYKIRPEDALQYARLKWNEGKVIQYKPDIAEKNIYFLVSRGEKTKGKTRKKG